MILKLINQVHSSKKGIALSLLRSCLYFVSLFYRFSMAVRNASYDACYYWGRGIKVKFFRLNIYNFKPRVISIGNIVAGGTGKTPLTILIAKKILMKNKKLAILSRGYKAKMESNTFGPQQISQGHGPQCSALECGDEPYLISRSVPEALFYVGKNRVESARMATDDNVKVILLDDGMQYRKLYRSYEVVVIDAQDPFGQNYFLPRGFLREHPKSLKRADLIVINHIQNKLQFDQTLRQVRHFSSAPAVGARPKYLKTISLCSKLEVPLKGRRVLAFCGIAKPNYFFDLLKDQGVQIVSKYVFADHQPVPARFLATLSQEIINKEIDWVICTEKDGVKLENLKLDLPIAYVQMELEIVYGQQEFDQAIEEMV